MGMGMGVDGGRGSSYSGWVEVGELWKEKEKI
jgi:hypothetical protein